MCGHALWITVGLLVSGCFAPRITNDAFRCEVRDDPPCPTGFYCYSGRCVHDGADVGSEAPHDLGRDAAAESDLSVPADRDLAQSLPDLTMLRDLTPPPDLTPPADLATGMCGHAGAPCTSIQDCCSQYCRTDGICIGG
jgi:hypothetical protein